MPTCSSLRCGDPADGNFAIAGGKPRPYCDDCVRRARLNGLTVEESGDGAAPPPVVVAPPLPAPAPTPAPKVKPRPVMLPAFRLPEPGKPGPKPAPLPEAVTSPAEPTRCCFNADCARPARSRGMCKVHYETCRKRGEFPDGTPAARITAPPRPGGDHRQLARDETVAQHVRSLFGRLARRRPDLAVSLALELLDTATAGAPRLSSRATLAG